MQRMRIDFTQTVGAMKPLHGINNSRMALKEPLEELRAAGIPYVRLHDTGGQFGGSRFVDIPNVFPDADADPERPESYDFAFTDAYVAQLVASGTEPFYRLGVTIENDFRIRSYHIDPPADPARWARICAGIVRHYTAGWADGFHFPITYWEIWNEPENPPMWSGSMQQYFELYQVTATTLKAEFPSIRVGGYASCGFYVTTRESAPDWHHSFVTWFEEFLAFVRSTGSPLDFFSWHLYTDDPEEIVQHADYVDGQLRAHGFEDVENIFDEWNFIDHSHPQPFVNLKEAPGAAFTAAAFCLMQDSPIDKAMYYDALPTRRYCGLYYFPSFELTPTYYAFQAFNELYRLGNQSGGDSGRLADRLYGCAAHDAECAAVLLVNNGSEPTRLQLDIVGPQRLTAVQLIDAEHRFEKDLTVFDSDRSVVTLPPISVVLLTTDQSPAEVDSPAAGRGGSSAPVAHGGLQPPVVQ